MDLFQRITQEAELRAQHARNALGKGWKHSEQAKEKIRAASYEMWKEPEKRSKLSQAAYDSWHGPKAEERRKKLSKSLKKYIRKNGFWLTGREDSKETRAKKSAAAKGKPKSDAHRAALSAAWKRNSKGWAAREASLEHAMVNWWRSKGLMAFKLDAVHYAGAPDRLFVLPNGRCIFVEFKRPDGSTTVNKLQERMLIRLAWMGHDTYICDNRRRAIEYFREALATAQVSRKSN